MAGNYDTSYESWVDQVPVSFRATGIVISLRDA